MSGMGFTWKFTDVRKKVTHQILKVSSYLINLHDYSYIAYFQDSGGQYPDQMAYVLEAS